MLAGVIEWFAKRLALEPLKRRLVVDQSGEDRKVESELYDTFVTESAEIDLTEVAGVDESERVSDELRGEIVNLTMDAFL